MSIESLTDSELIKELENRGFYVLLFHTNGVIGSAMVINEERKASNEKVIDLDEIEQDAEFILNRSIKKDKFYIMGEDLITEYIEENY